MAQRQRLFLIDGMSIAYRSYFAFIQRPLINSKGENTSAIYGFVTFLNKILEDERPEYIGVAMDTSAPTFRHKEYKQYKATRQKMPEDMAAQLETLREVIRAYGIPVLEVDGYEADDVMGTLAKRAEQEGVETYLVTSDKDFMQLVSPKIKLYKPGRQGTEVDIISFDGVEKKFGVLPDRVTDVLGLIGDKSDNVPGVPGIGEKTAIPLIREFGSLERLLENADAIPQKGIKEKLKKNKDLALLSKRLVTIDTRVPVDTDFHVLKAGSIDVRRLRELFQRLEFRTLLKKLDEEAWQSAERDREVPEQPAAPGPTLSDISTDPHSYSLVQTESDFRSLCRTLQSAERFVIDTETTSTDPLRADVVGISFSIKEHEAFYVPVEPSPAAGTTDLFGHSVPSESRKRSGLPGQLVFSSLKPVLEDESIGKVGQNIKYDLLVLSRNGIWLRGIEFDTMVASYLIREDAQHNLDALAREYLGYSTITYDDLTGTGKDRKDIRQVPLERLAEYSCQDADITLRLYHVLRKRLEIVGMTSLARDIEFPLIQVLARMESEGVAIDVPYLHDMAKELERMLDNLTRDIHRLAGEQFNINSTQQLSDVLFNRLKLPPVRKTKTGFSTDVAVLETLRNEHPIVTLLLDYRQLAKLKSTYVDALPQLLHPDTGRVHTSFNQTVASTGRLSSSDPNLQNIPIRTEIGRSIRKAFIPRSGSNLLLSADYSQIELRVMAHISGDEGLRSAFLNDEDIHATTAAKVFGVSMQDVTKEMRRKAKEVNFGIMYGIGPFGLARRLEIPQTEAKEIIEKYFERFPRVRQYINDTIETARGRGYVSTLLGRRRYLPDLRSRNQNVRSNAERQAINMPIQGTSADMIKIAMVRIEKALREGKFSSAMVLQVHDELVFDVPRPEQQTMSDLVTHYMKSAIELSVPVEVEIAVGKNWLEAD